MHVPHAFFGQIVKLLSRLLKTVSEADVDHARIADAMSAATVAVCAIAQAFCDTSDNLFTWLCLLAGLLPDQTQLRCTY